MSSKKGKTCTRKTQCKEEEKENEIDDGTRSELLLDDEQPRSRSERLTNNHSRTLTILKPDNMKDC